MILAPSSATPRPSFTSPTLMSQGNIQLTTHTPLPLHLGFLAFAGHIGLLGRCSGTSSSNSAAFETAVCFPRRLLSVFASSSPSLPSPSPPPSGESISNSNNIIDDEPRIPPAPATAATTLSGTSHHCLDPAAAPPLPPPPPPTIDSRHPLVRGAVSTAAADGCGTAAHDIEEQAARAAVGREFLERGRVYARGFLYVGWVII
ncbi:hypothetical protein VTK26DRAFT_645 [Humicola hyalothermophila]